MSPGQTPRGAEGSHLVKGRRSQWGTDAAFAVFVRGASGVLGASAVVLGERKQKGVEQAEREAQPGPIGVWPVL